MNKTQAHKGYSGVTRGPSRSTNWPPPWLSPSENPPTAIVEPVVAPRPVLSVAVGDDPFCQDDQHQWLDSAESDGRTRRFCTSCCKFGGFVQADGSTVVP